MVEILAHIHQISFIFNMLKILSFRLMGVVHEKNRILYMFLEIIHIFLLPVIKAFDWK